MKRIKKYLFLITYCNPAFCAAGASGTGLYDNCRNRTGQIK